MTRATAGRPRCFCQETALEKALEVFWNQGYEGTSLTDLTKAMGINKPSMYATFGNKEQLFLKAIERYKIREGKHFFAALDKPDIKDTIRDMMSESAKIHCDKDKPKGCLMVQGALACSSDASQIKQALMDMRCQGLDSIHQRFEQAKQDNQLKPNADPKAMSHFTATVLHGMSVHSVDNVPDAMIEKVASMASEYLLSLCK